MALVEKSGPPSETSFGPAEAQIDINQFELAMINRALRGDTKARNLANIGKKKRILRIQRRNLISLCKDLGKPCDARSLEATLRKVFSGKSTLRLMGIAPQQDR